MLTRNEKGKLVLNILEMGIFILDLFEECKTRRECDELLEHLQSCVENCHSDRLKELDAEEE